MNENIKQLTGCSVLDEKMLGTCHIGTGMNAMFGGSITKGSHRDYVFRCQVDFLDDKGEILLNL